MGEVRVLSDPLPPEPPELTIRLTPGVTRCEHCRDIMDESEPFSIRWVNDRTTAWHMRCSPDVIIVDGPTSDDMWDWVD